MFNLTPRELTFFKKLNTPIKIQNFLDSLPINWEKNGETYMSPRRVLKMRKMHCFEGALCAALALWINDEEPLLLDLKARGDDDHVVALYKRHGYWGAISKTNHATLRFRDPIYKTIRELALSYFHEYFINSSGKKVLYSYSRPFNLKTLGSAWVTANNELYDVVDTLDAVRHTVIVPTKNKRFIRPADAVERRAGKLIEWARANPRV